MKKLFTLLLAFSFATGIFSQAPEKMSYQAVIRDVTGELVKDREIGMQISILYGTTSGKAIYVETQTPTTNGSGLVSIEIGAGTVVSGDFTIIDWTNGPYFIKTETDPDGKISYTITGTSQLLSVPYAMHAKTAESVTGEITESQISDLQTYYLASNPDGFISDYTVTEEDVTAHQGALGITESQITDLDHFTTADETDPTVTTYSVGDFAQGGIVFWVDETGQHGLVAAKVDQSTGIQWYNGSSTTTNAVRDGIDAGMYNTERIIANQGVGSYAAQLCANYQGGGYGDWYLPSKYELNLLYLQKFAVGGFARAYYWSSSEYNFANAWMQHFGGGDQYGNGKGLTYYVRAVRAF